MDFELSPVEVRILGCLIEKEATTPDVYPLTLNGLLTACNQKSSREPVMDLCAEDLAAPLESLTDKTLVSDWNSNRTRMAKYLHKLSNRVFEEFNFSQQELAVLAVLFLRGPQSAGEIRTRCSRIFEFDDPDAVKAVLESLEQRPDGPYVTMLARREGQKDVRFAHLFSGEVSDLPQARATSGSTRSDQASRLEGLEQEVSDLRQELEELRQRFEEFARQFE